MTLHSGTVAWYNPARGFGFLRCSECEDVYVHCTSVLKSGAYGWLQEGDEVEFEVIHGDCGPRANCVMVLNRCDA